MNLYHTRLSKLYREIETLGDPLTGISDRIDFERIRSILMEHPYAFFKGMFHFGHVMVATIQRVKT